MKPIHFAIAALFWNMIVNHARIATLEKDVLQLKQALHVAQDKK
jgi:hypothetical protein